MEVNVKLNGIQYKSLKTLEDSVDSGIISFLQEWYDSKDYVIGHTSGSTGKPKEIRLLKKDMLASARLTNEYFRIDSHSHLLLCLSPVYIAGKMMLVRAMLAGANLITIKPSSSPLSEVEEEIDFAAMVPMQVEATLQTPETLAKFARIKQVIIGGAAVSSSLEKRLQEIQTACFGTYGMTETVSHIALRRINGWNHSSNYFALGKVSFSTDERECLVIHAPHLQQQTFVTNDIVRLVDSTRFEWLGRYDNVINSGGVKLFPEAIESRIAPLLSHRFFVMAEDDERLGQRVVLVIESTPWTEMEIQKLNMQLKSCLSPYETPKKIYFQERFTETYSGKIVRKIFLSLPR